MATRKAECIRYTVFPVAWGWCAAADTERGLCEFVLPRVSEADAEADILSRRPGARSPRAPPPDPG